VPNLFLGSSLEVASCIMRRWEGISSITIGIFPAVEDEPLKGICGAVYDSAFVVERSSVGDEIMSLIELEDDDCFPDRLRSLFGGERIE